MSKHRIVLTVDVSNEVYAEMDGDIMIDGGDVAMGLSDMLKGELDWAGYDATVGVSHSIVEDEE